MSTSPQQRSTLSVVLRTAVSESLKAGETFAGLERSTGVLRQTLMRFIRDEQHSLGLDAADRLAQHFGLELQAIKKPNRKGI